MGYNRQSDKMKKMILTLVIVFATLTSFSQATLLHSFTNHGSDIQPVFQQSIREYVCEVLPEVSYVLGEYDDTGALRGFSVYDASFELTKEIPFTLNGEWITSFTGFNVVIAGKHLFNTDDKIEIGLCVRSMYGGGTATTVFINEEGEILFCENGYLLNGIYRVGNELRFDLVDYSENYNLEIYATQGNLSAEEMVITQQNPYPNPAKFMIALPYTVNGKATEMHVYDSQGRLVDTKMLSPDADRIHLNVSTYAPGIYVYEYNGVSNKFIVE
jgi:hypothetical protein